MPYSKNPDKYPLDLFDLLEALASGLVTQLTLPCASLPEARSKRVMIQSFFTAVERRAKDLREAADRQAIKRNANEGKLGELVQDAEAIAQNWEHKARVATKWMLKVEEYTCSVIVCKRVITGAFGDSLRSALQQINALDVNAPVTAAEVPPPQAAEVPRAPLVALAPVGQSAHPQGLSIEEQIELLNRMAPKLVPPTR